MPRRRCLLCDTELSKFGEESKWGIAKISVTKWKCPKCDTKWLYGLACPVLLDSKNSKNSKK